MSKFEKWLADLVNKLTGCKDDVKALQEQVSRLNLTLEGAAAKGDVQGLDLKISNAITELKRLAEFTVGLSKKVDELPAASPIVPDDLLTQIREINDALSNLPELPE